jgi:signal transduction histidine kinase
MTRPPKNTANLLIRDDGIGGADPVRGSGLTGVVDRVEALGGTVDIRSARGDGTRIAIMLPLDVEAINDRDDLPSQVQ